MVKKLDQLKTLLGEVVDLKSAQGVLGWDQETLMPPAAPKEGDINSELWQKLPMKNSLQTKSDSC